MVVHRDRVGGAEAPRQIERSGAARDGDHARAGVARKLRQDRAEEADPDDGDGLARLDRAATKDVHRASQRLARERCLAGKRIRKLHQPVGAGDIVVGEAPAGEPGDPVAEREAAHAGPERIDDAPGLMAEPAGLAGVGEPIRDRPMVRDWRRRHRSPPA